MPQTSPEESNRDASAEAIRIRGARTHNLQNIDVDIPRNRLVVITGVSGSGKSSLAFDTLLAEGQRQYIDSLSIYARQFFDQRQRPEVDHIEGLQPAIAIDQSQGGQSPRSTVGTITEAYDYLRLLFARAGAVSCPKCGEAITQQTPEEIQTSIEALPDGSRAMLLAPLVQGRKGKHGDVLESARKAGFVRLRVDGATYPFEDAPELAPQKVHDIEAVVDRVVLRDGVAARLAESVRLAIKHGDGVVRVVYQTPEDKQQNGSANGAQGGAPAQNSENGWQEQLFNTRYACPVCKTGVAEVEPRTFSFNSPYGACPACSGMGVQVGFDPELVAPDVSLSLRDGAIGPWRRLSPAARAKRLESIADFLSRAGVTEDQPLDQWPAQAVQELLTGDGRGFLGVLMLLEQEFSAAKRPATQERLEAFRGEFTCPDCGGARLRPEARGCRVGGVPIHELSAMPIGAARDFLHCLEWDEERSLVATPLVTEIVRRLDFLISSGVDYLSLDRPGSTLSGGELQRVRLATGIGSGLTGVMYLLDEPSIGLHPRDNDRLIASLRDLERQGNTVIVVEHDEAVMRAADWLIDIGPGAGHKGGRLVAEGAPDEVAGNRESLTGDYLSGRRRISPPSERRNAKGAPVIELIGASLHNLKEVDLRAPIGSLTVVTGVSGSGKSSLVIDTLARALARKLNGAGARPGPHRTLRGLKNIDRVVHVDQSPIGRSPRSNAATYTGALDEIRKVFARTKLARQRGYKTGRFSFNVKGGRCEECQGQGVRKIEMNFLPDLYVTCSVCHGARFNRQTLAVKYREKSIADVLSMSVEDAMEFFANLGAIRRLLEPLRDVGLGYLGVGQSSNTLSGGEAQRIKLAAELGMPRAGHTLYILDEPTTGLHIDDIRRLLGVLNQLVDAGNTVLMIEHQLDVIRSADWLIDLGPEGGAGGGEIVAQGTPEEVAACADSETGKWLKPLLD